MLVFIPTEKGGSFSHEGNVSWEQIEAITENRSQSKGKVMPPVLMGPSTKVSTYSSANNVGKGQRNWKIVGVREDQQVCTQTVPSHMRSYTYEVSPIKSWLLKHELNKDSNKKYTKGRKPTASPAGRWGILRVENV